MAALPPLKNARTPCKTTKCLCHISRGLNFGGVRRHFGLPLQSSNLIGDFRGVAAIRNLCCRFQRFIDGRQRKATASCFKARQTILCADIFCQSHTYTQLSALIRLGWVAISNGKEGAGAHDPTPPACHIIHVRTSELNKVFTVGEATLVPSESSARSPIRRDRREIALINGYHPTT